MSIGYETQIPPISTVTFYNAIANNGVMVKPKFVKAIMKDGQVVKEIPTEVLNPAIASPKTIQEIQVILEKVVSEGLGRQAGSKQFHVSGKQVQLKYLREDRDTPMVCANIWLASAAISPPNLPDTVVS